MPVVCEGKSTHRTCLIHAIMGTNRPKENHNLSQEQPLGETADQICCSQYIVHLISSAAQLAEVTLCMYAV